jgi:hypothetical protein
MKTLIEQYNDAVATHTAGPSTLRQIFGYVPAEGDLAMIVGESKVVKGLPAKIPPVKVAAAKKTSKKK